MSTIIKLCNCYELDSNYNHSVTFNTKQYQNLWFNQKVIHELNEVNYQRKNNNISLGLTLEELKMCNYLIALNDDGSIYYYFIMDKVYKNERSTEIIIKLDVIQTYWFDIGFYEGTIEREHCNRWGTDKNYINKFMEDEGLETGEYIIKNRTNVYDYNNKGCYIITSSDRLGVSSELRPGEKENNNSGSDVGDGGVPSNGEWISKNEYLTLEEMQNNAKLFWDYFKSKGWTLNSVCGMLGNIQTESYINPGIWESFDEGNLENGYGLVQWTPSTKYITWGGTDFKNGNKQCERIIYEMENNLQWYATSIYNLTFEEFSKSTLSPTYLARAFIENYERPFDTNQPIRWEQAEYWYNYLK